MLELKIKIHELLAADLTIGDAMAQLIESHAAAYPEGDWAPFRAIGYARE